MAHNSFLWCVCLLWTATALYGAGTEPAVPSAQHMRFATQWLGVAKEASSKLTQGVEKVDLHCELANVQAAIGDWQGAQATIDAVKGMNGGPERLMPGVFSDIAAAQARAGRVTEALATADKIGDEYSRMNAYENIAVAQAQSGDLAGARATVQRLKDEVQKLGVLCEIAAVQCTRADREGWIRELQTAETIAMRLPDGRDAGRAFCIIAEAYRAGSELPRARQILRNASAIVFPKAGAQEEGQRLMDLAETQIRLGDIDAAQHTLQMAKQRIVGDQRIMANARQRLAALLNDAGETQAAVALIESIPKDDVQSRVKLFVEVAVAQSKRGDLEEASRNLVRARRAAEMITDLWSQVMAFARIADASLNMGHRAEACQDLQQAEMAAKREDSPLHRGEQLSVLAVCRLAAGDADGARRLCSQVKRIGDVLEDQRDRRQLFDFLRGSAAEAGRFVGHWSIVELASPLYGKERECVAKADAQVERGEFAAATQTAALIADQQCRRDVNDFILAREIEAGDLSTADTWLTSVQHDALRAHFALVAADKALRTAREIEKGW